LREVRTFVRVDTDYGIRGFNIPRCRSVIEKTCALTSGFEIFDDTSTITLGQRVVLNYFRCSLTHPESESICLNLYLLQLSIPESKFPKPKS